MIVTHDDLNPVVLSNVSSTGEFKIKNSARAFSILSSGLYSNKIKAIIRELGCNATDSHKAANKDTVPFEVHLPSALEPWFSIRDFGTGLSANDVSHIYTTYFESTKTQSNDYIGALGLGSKSPFSYTDNFSVTAIKDGKKNIFSAFISEQGVPSIALLDSSDSDEENGVEVKFSVHNEYDYRKFRDEAAEVFKWFSLKPTVIGNYYPSTNSYTRTDIIPGVHLQTGNRRSVAVMGNIAYPLGNFPNKEQVLGSLAFLLESGLELHFNIGELDFSASREELSYDAKTIASIQKKFENLAEFILLDVKEKADAVENLWERALYLTETRRQNIFKAAVDRYIADTQFQLCSINNDYSYLHTFSWTDDELYNLHNISVRKFITSNRAVKQQHFRKNYLPDNESNIEIEIPIENSVTFVLNDIRIGAITRIRHHFSESRHHGKIYLIDSPVELDKRSEFFDKFLSLLCNPSNVIRASELTREIKEKKISATILKCRYRASEWSDRSRILWDEIDEIPDDNEICYYVPLTGITPLIKMSTDEYEPFVEYSFCDLVGNIRQSSIATLKNATIYGVRKRKLAEIEKKSNWISIVDAIKDSVTSITESELNQIIAYRFFDNLSDSAYTNKLVVPHIDKNSPYALLTESKRSVSSCLYSSEGYQAMTWLCNTFCNEKDIDKRLNSVKKLYDTVKSTYPLLGHLGYYNDIDSKIIAQYVNLIDKSTTQDLK